MYKSDVHGFEIPTVDDDIDKWGNMLNTLINELDSIIIAVGPRSERSTATVEGAWYYATDEETIYYSDGSSWTDVFGISAPTASFAFDRVYSSTIGQGFSFQGDSDTGVGLETVGAVALYTGGTSALSSDSTGTDIPNGILTEQGSQAAIRSWVNSSASIANSSLDNSSITVAGNAVSLGASTAVGHGNLTSIGSSNHHTRYADEEAEDTTAGLLTGGADITLTYDDPNNSLTIQTIEEYTDEEAQDTTASLLQSGSGISLSYDDPGNSLTIEVTGDYTDEKAQDTVSAMFTSQFSYDDAGNSLSLNQGEGSGLDADKWDGFELEKNGTNGSNVLNFTTI